MRRTTMILVLALLALAGGAIAATPESGKVSKAAPSVKWSGETLNSYLLLNPMNNQPEAVPCDGEACDKFTLTVEDDAPDLEIAVNVDDDDATAGIRVVRPDGTVEYSSGDSNTKSAHKLKLKNATKGEYEVGVINNFVGAITYKASATLLYAAAAAPAPEPEPTTQPQTQPQPGQQQSSPAPTVTVKAGKASAKKLKKARKLAVTASSSQAITSVTAEILKGTKRVASAKVAKLEGTKKITVKVKKGLKKGSYTMRVVGTDSQNRRVQGQAKLTVKK